jgi:hypothetical protein
MIQSKTMVVRRRCARCGSTLFVSQDPLDDPGTTYCLAGHTFLPRPPLPLAEDEMPVARRARKRRAAA